jgi:hypothetical protein
MFNPTLIVIETFIRDIRAMYGRNVHEFGAQLSWDPELCRAARSRNYSD